MIRSNEQYAEGEYHGSHGETGATAEKEMNKWIAVDKVHVDGGLTGTPRRGELNHLMRRLPRHHRYGVLPRSRAP